MTSPIPVVATDSGDVEDAPAGAIPLAAYGFGGGSGGGGLTAKLATSYGPDPLLPIVDRIGFVETSINITIQYLEQGLYFTGQLGGITLESGGVDREDGTYMVGVTFPAGTLEGLVGQIPMVPGLPHRVIQLPGLVRILKVNGHDQESRAFPVVVIAGTTSEGDSLSVSWDTEAQTELTTGSGRTITVYF